MADKRYNVTTSYGAVPSQTELMEPSAEIRKKQKPDYIKDDFLHDLKKAMKRSPAASRRVPKSPKT